MSARIEADQLVPTSSTPPEDAGFYRHSQNVVGVTGSIVSINPYTKTVSAIVAAQSGTPAKMVKLTQAEYNALTPDSNTLYIIVG